MTWRTCLLLCALAACLSLDGCRPPQGDSNPEIALDLAVTPDPPVTGPANVRLTLTDKATGQPVQGAEVRLEGNMSHAGMRPVFGAARETEPGRYETSLDLHMGGDWFILVDATLRDGRSLQRQVDLPDVHARQD
ncbi:MAG TPA: FixH family protein [Thermoanaerobaculia bacterium]|nr:FixH family protein [Thermoanaerobaculia bacterium]